MKKALILTALTLLGLLTSNAFAQPLRGLVGEWMSGTPSLHYRDTYTLNLSGDGGLLGGKVRIGSDGTYRMKVTLYSFATDLARVPSVL